MSNRLRYANFLFFPVMVILGCTNADYRFDRVDGNQPVSLPLKFDGFSGLRDGASVKAQGRFANGPDVVTMDIDLYLRPPAEFRSGVYHAVIGGNTSFGTVECPSLIFQGGQTALPTLGGVFVLKDVQNRPLYRVRIPATTMTAPKR